MIGVYVEILVLDMSKAISLLREWQCKLIVARFVACHQWYGQFSKFHVCFCGLDPGNLKFQTVWTHERHICF